MLEIRCTAEIPVKRVGDNVHATLPNGDVLVLTPESARDFSHWLRWHAEAIQLEQAGKRKDARQAETGRARS